MTLMARLAILLLVAALAAAAPAGAAEVSGIEIPDQVRLDDQTLILNGAGVRRKFFFRIYVGALYLPRATTDAQQAITMPGPKRVLMHFIYDELTREQIVEAWKDGFDANLTTEQLQALDDAINRFNELFTAVASGDELYIDYLPGEGTRVMLNGVTRGIVDGEALAQAVLRIFLGEDPADSSLKRGMLGRG